MKMVDGSTVRHGRLDCHYPRKSERRRRSYRHAGGAVEEKEKRKVGTVMRREEERRRVAVVRIGIKGRECRRERRRERWQTV